MLGIEEFAFPILDAILHFEGRAPDQYRILPYLLMRVLSDALSLVPGNTYGLRLPIILFDAGFLLLSAIMLRKAFGSAVGLSLIGGLFLIYPYLMFDGYRPDSSFMLFMSTLTFHCLRKAGEGGPRNTLLFVLTLLLLSFSRADVALLYAVAGLGILAGQSVLLRVTCLALPVLVQLLLSRVIFPEAVYFSDVVMLQENFTRGLLLLSPLSCLVLAVMLAWFAPIRDALAQAARTQPWVLFAMVGYTLTLFVIAMPNEYRLFLPLLPLVLHLRSHSGGTLGDA